MHALELQHDVISYSPAISACELVSQWAQGLQFLREMPCSTPAEQPNLQRSRQRMQEGFAAEVA